MITTPKLGLVVWNDTTDPYSHEELAENWAKVDQHDHTDGKGAKIGTAAIEDSAVTAAKLAPGAIPSLTVDDGSITSAKLGTDSVTTAKIANGAVTDAKLAVGLLTVPTGSLFPYAGSSAPSGYFLCNGTAISRTTYSTLFGVLGVSYGAGDGSTTFNLPDLRGRVPVGLGTHGDVDARSDNEGLGVGSRTPNHTHSNGSYTADVPNMSLFAVASAAGGQATGATFGFVYDNNTPVENSHDTRYTTLQVGGVALATGAPVSGVSGNGGTPYAVFTYIIKHGA